MNRILVIEDDQIIRDSLESLLINHGYKYEND